MYVPEVGDIVLYQEGYYEIDSLTANQYFGGKNPAYPNNQNPLNPGLERFGSSYIDYSIYSLRPLRINLIFLLIKKECNYGKQ